MVINFAVIESSGNVSLELCFSSLTTWVMLIMGTGESKYMHGLTTIPPSRFSSSNPNGLQEYSPFLCGVGM